MLESWLPWIVAAIVAIGSASVAVILVRRERRRAARRAENETAVHQQVVTDQVAAHRGEVDRYARDRDLLAAELESFRRLAFSSAHWELQSRQLIAGVCEELSLNGVLATNVMFVPVGTDPARVFVAQVDHVVVTDHFVVVIENKNWKGLVMDGCSPHVLHPALAKISPTVPADQEFAMQLQLDPNGAGITCRVDAEKNSPRYQVRRQAVRLAELARHRLGKNVCWFNTAVLYSHPDVLLFTDATRSPRKRTDTPVLGGRQGLREFLEELRRRSATGQPTSPVDQLAPLLADLGADVLGLGEHADRWPDAIGTTPQRRAPRPSRAT